MDKMKELYEKVASDSTLQAKFSQILVDAEKSGKEATETKMVAFAKEAGYDVTLEEIQEFFKNLAEKNGELSDSELDMVAGGKVDIGKVANSVGTYAIGCVEGSLTSQIFQGSCLEYFNK